jgi:hypothetical protein
LFSANILLSFGSDFKRKKKNISCSIDLIDEGVYIEQHKRTRKKSEKKQTFFPLKNEEKKIMALIQQENSLETILPKGTKVPCEIIGAHTICPPGQCVLPIIIM